MSPADTKQIARILGAGVEDAAAAAAARFAERAEHEGLAEVAYASLDTPLGTALVANTELGLVRVMLPNESVDEILELVKETFDARELNEGEDA